MKEKLGGMVLLRLQTAIPVCGAKKSTPPKDSPRSRRPSPFKNIYHIKIIMKKTTVLFAILFTGLAAFAQTNPAITGWLINTSDLKGQHYVQGNSTPIQDNVLANVQSVQYSNDWAYVAATGIPAYVTGPFLDGNPSLATEQTGFFKIPLNPVQNTGTPTATTGGNIGIFVNGVALFDYRDGVAWNSTTGTPCGGPGNSPCPGGPMATQNWNRDAVLAERGGFDCSKAHPAMGNYHHHQNPSAFNLDQMVLSNICDLYPADGLYAINASEHSPLLGFAYDGFPVYGAYAFKNTDGTGGITRMKSGYQLRNITMRTTSPTGVDVPDGPDVSTTYPLGYYREDYEFIANSEPDYLDEHNGRFCVTPEYPNGIYCYFATVDDNWNSAYPYVVGPTFYGVRTGTKVTNIGEAVTTYNPTSALSEKGLNALKTTIYPNPSSDFVAVQIDGLLKEELTVSLYDMNGRKVQETTLQPGSTIAYLDTQTLYSGQYVVVIALNGEVAQREKLILQK